MAFKEGKSYLLPGFTSSNPSTFEGGYPGSGSEVNDDIFYNDTSIALYNARRGFLDETRLFKHHSETDRSITRMTRGFNGTYLNANTAFKLTASDASASDQFGFSVAVGSGVIAVGSPGDDDNGSASGSVYAYNPVNGALLSKIKPSDGAAGDNFGYSVAVGSNFIAVGAPGDDDVANVSGSVWLFDTNVDQFGGANGLSTPKKITASDPATNDQFGWSVAIGCNRVVVGAPFKSSGAGAIYIYRIDRSTISNYSFPLLKKISVPTARAGDYFGYSVAVANGRIVVGAPYDSDNGSGTGAAYIYDLDGNLIKKVYGDVNSPATSSPRSSSDNFGWTVAAGSGRIVVGAPGRAYWLYHAYSPGQFFGVTQDSTRGRAFGVAFSFDSNGTQAGIATPHVTFRTPGIDGTVWFDNGYTSNRGVYTVTKIVNNQETPFANVYETFTNAKFAYSVAVGDGFVVCGSPYQYNKLYPGNVSEIDTQTPGVAAGAAYVYSCKASDNDFSIDPQLPGVGYTDKLFLSSYSLASTIFPNTTATFEDRFGESVACGWNCVVIGCPRENTPAGVDAGAVYVLKTTERSTSIFEQILDAYGKDD